MGSILGEKTEAVLQVEPTVELLSIRAGHQLGPGKASGVALSLRLHHPKFVSEE